MCLFPQGQSSRANLRLVKNFAFGFCYLADYQVDVPVINVHTAFIIMNNGYMYQTSR